MLYLCVSLFGVLGVCVICVVYWLCLVLGSLHIA